MSALVACALELDAVEQGDAVRDRDEFDVAAAFGLEGLFDLRSRPPFGGETLIGVDGERAGGTAGTVATASAARIERKSVRIGASFIAVEKELRRRS